MCIGRNLCLQQVYFDGRVSAVFSNDAPWWNRSYLFVECFPSSDGKEYVGYTLLAAFVLLFYTLGWPIATFVYLRHCVYTHAYIVQEADMPADEKITLRLLNGISPSSSSHVGYGHFMLDICELEASMLEMIHVVCY